MTKEIVVHTQEVARKIFLMRGHRVMIDRDLAELYEVSTKALNQAVKRNGSRFPDDFMFQLTQDETRQLVTNCDRFTSLKHASTTPYAFTEQGVAMLSSVLKSERAAQVNISIMRAFVRIRELVLSNKVILQKLESLERKYATHDVKIETLFEEMREFMTEPKKPARRIGFRPPDTSGKTKAKKKE